MKKVLLILLLFTVSCSSPDEPVVYDMQGYVEDVRIDSEGGFINILVNGQMETQEAQQ